MLAFFSMKAFQKSSGENLKQDTTICLHIIGPVLLEKFASIVCFSVQLYYDIQLTHYNTCYIICYI